MPVTHKQEFRGRYQTHRTAPAIAATAGERRISPGADVRRSSNQVTRRPFIVGLPELAPPKLELWGSLVPPKQHGLACIGWRGNRTCHEQPRRTAYYF